MKGIYFYKTMLETAKMLSNEEKNQMFDIMLSVTEGGELPKDIESPMLKMWVESVRGLIEVQKEKQERMNDARRENGKKGGRPKKNASNESSPNELNNTTNSIEKVEENEAKVLQIKSNTTKVGCTELSKYLSSHILLNQLTENDYQLLNDMIVEGNITSYNEIDTSINIMIENKAS